MTISVHPDSGILLFDEILPDLSNANQTMDVKSFPAANNTYLSQLYFCIYSLNSCEAPNNSAEITALFCRNTGDGVSYTKTKTLTFNPNTLTDFFANLQSLRVGGFQDSGRNDILVLPRDYIGDGRGWVSLVCNTPGIRMCFFHEHAPPQ